MSTTISYTSYDYDPTTIVPVIASFTTDGHISPLYVRIHGDSLKVDTFWVRSRFKNKIEFHCKVIDQDCLKPIILTYYLNEGVWGIPKHR